MKTEQLLFYESPTSRPIHMNLNYNMLASSVNEIDGVAIEQLEDGGDF